MADLSYKNLLESIHESRRAGEVVDDKVWQELYDSCNSFRKMAEGHMWAKDVENEKWRSNFLAGMKNFVEGEVELKSLLRAMDSGDPDWDCFSIELKKIIEEIDTVSAWDSFKRLMKNGSLYFKEAKNRIAFLKQSQC